MKKWETPIPTTPKQRNLKRCYAVWKKTGFSKMFRLVDGVVWLTDAELTLAILKYSDREFELVLERDRLEAYKKYLDKTIE
jgi:hypothetical protein